MNLSFKERFFPNECHICRSRQNLRMCKCNMISYCSEKHRLEHLPIHEHFCQTVNKVLKEKGLLYINEKFTTKDENKWNNGSEDMLQFETKLGRRMTPLELSMWIRPRVCFYCNNFPQMLSDCPKCPIASFCYIHYRINYSNEYHDNCTLMNRYLKTLSLLDELNIDMQFLPSYFPYTTEERFEFLDPLTYSMNDSSSDSQCKESISTKQSLLDFINIASRLSFALTKIYNTMPEKIVLHIDAFTHDHAIINANYWEFLLHVYPKIRNLKIIITGSRLLQNSLMNYSLCEKCVKLEKTLSVEKYSSTYEDYVLKSYYQLPDVLFHFRIANDYNFKRFNAWNRIGCPIILLADSEFNRCKKHYFHSFLFGNFQIIFNGKINTVINEEGEFDIDSYFIIFESRKIKKQQELNSSIDEVAKLKQELNSSTVEVAKLKQKLNLSTLEVAKLNSSTDEVARLKQKLNSSTDEVAKLKQKLNSSTDEVAKLKQKLNSSTDEVGKLKQELNSSTDEVAKLQQELNSSTDEVAKLQKRIEEFEKSDFQLKEKIQSIDEIFQTLKMETLLQVEKENS
ncbi:uncharacterized protein LOC122508647 [Leptopilina heterotoma]|uniref:uncharacterized protein LOC122508647 n=1 Tax=Leptopilina heterotoma TaxID=63436 RepID=UPI001CA82652|nr:uncharacterized protein LOC122508647 [Leptopilina heterotoma]